MSKIGSVVVSAGLLSRRSYGVFAGAAVNVVHASAAAAAMPKTDVAAAAADASSKKQFWMRDPRTGWWVPENRFEEVDVVDLRNRLTRQQQHKQ